jgi:hypothetical protein
VRRVPASEIEALVIKSVRDHLNPSEPIDNPSLVHTHVARVEVQPNKLVIHLAEGASTLEALAEDTVKATPGNSSARGDSARTRAPDAFGDACEIGGRDSLSLLRIISERSYDAIRTELAW